MENQTETVSVVMCTYNGAEFLRQQLNSILAQTYPIREIIVQDDGSTDATVAIIREYAALHPEIRFFQNERNLGFNENFRTAILRATSTFVAISDQDDVWFPNKIERLVACIGDCDLCYSDITRGTTQESATLVSYKPQIESLLFRAILGHAMLLRREFAQAPSSWHRVWFYDWSLALSAYLSGRGIAKVSEPLVWHRLHSDEVSSHIGSVDHAPKIWEPYVKGWRVYRELQTTDKWRQLYSSLLCDEGIHRFPLAKSILECLLSRNICRLLHLCFLCMTHRKTIYPGNTHGIVGLMRGFAFPSIYAFYNRFLFYK